MNKNKYTILVNSCDAFADCWVPFFKLLKLNWQNCDVPIILNTENLDYTCGDLEIVASKVAKRLKHKLTWSEALLLCLERVQTDIILYVQEDYFLNGKVDTNKIDYYADLIKSNKWVNIQLTGFGSSGPFADTEIRELQSINSKSRYRISLQAALWAVEELRNLLRAHENAWQFEILGSIRSRQKETGYYAVKNPDSAGKALNIFPYIKTGIIKGQWYAPAVCDLFETNKIVINYTKRGFYNERPRAWERIRTITKVCAHPLSLWRSL